MHLLQTSQWIGEEYECKTGDDKVKFATEFCWQSLSIGDLKAYAQGFIVITSFGQSADKGGGVVDCRYVESILGGLDCTTATPTSNVKELWLLLWSSDPFVVGTAKYEEWRNHFLHKHGRHGLNPGLVVLRKVRKGHVQGDRPATLAVSKYT